MASRFHLWIIGGSLALLLALLLSSILVNTPANNDQYTSVHHEFSHEKRLVAEIVQAGSGAAGMVGGVYQARKGRKTIICESGRNALEDPILRNPVYANTISLSLNYNNYMGHIGTPYNNVFDNPLINRYMSAATANVESGGTAVNGMQAVRGTPREWQQICADAGDSVWCPPAMEQRFKKLEKVWSAPWSLNTTGRGTQGDVHIRGGSTNLNVSQFYLNVSMPLYFGPNASQFYIDDYNDFSTPLGGFNYWQVTQRPGDPLNPFETYWRENSQRSFANDLATNPNLEVITNCTVTRVLFNKQKKAYGIEALINGETTTIIATKQVILSAGLLTPKILLQSGYGDANDLNALGIHMVHHNPNVGKHILTHPSIAVLGVPNPYIPVVCSAARTDKNSSFMPLAQSINLEKIKEKVASINRELLPQVNAQSLLTNPFYTCDALNSQDPWAVYSGGIMAPSPLGDPADRAFFLLSGYNTQPITYFQLAGLYLHAESEGSLKLISRDPLALPRLDFGFFTSSQGFTEFADMTIMAKNIIQTIQNMGLIPINFASQEPILFDLNDPYALGNWTLNNFIQAYHWSGGARMAQSEATGVVDSRGRVFGVANLRIADTSILPRNVAGQLSAMITGLTVAELLDEDLN